MFKEFKEFAMKGSVIDLAVGVIIGAAFSKIVDSFVADILMPPLGLILGRIDFANRFIALNGQHYATLEEAKKAAAPTINYGLFINNAISFLIVAFVLFLVIRQVNRMRRGSDKPSEAELKNPTSKECPLCCSSIPIKARKCPSCTSELAA